MKDGVTVGVVTYERSELFAQMLDYLATSIRACTFPVDLVVVNNSGPVARADVLAVLDRSAIAEVCTVRLLDSAENNISIGRNLALDGCRTRLLAFLDDDEYPRPDWLSRLVACQASGVGQLVGGPILPVFPDAAPRWVKAIDLHNARGLATGDIIRRTATGNCLLDTAVLDGHRFDPAFGRSGGGDAHFFETLSRRGHTLVWCAEAIVEETISAERATARFALFRFIKQGNNFSRFMLADASWVRRIQFRLRAAVLAPVGIVGGALLWPFSARHCARWWKGGFTNLGKLLALRTDLYGEPRG